MDLFKNFLGNEIDLDDIDMYSPKLRNMHIHELFSDCMARAGSSLFYMDFLHGDEDWGDQRVRVEILCKELSNIWYNVRKFDTSPGTKHALSNEGSYRLSLLKWIYRFQDEVENQC